MASTLYNYNWKNASINAIQHQRGVYQSQTLSLNAGGLAREDIRDLLGLPVAQLGAYKLLAGLILGGGVTYMVNGGTYLTAGVVAVGGMGGGAAAPTGDGEGGGMFPGDSGTGVVGGGGDVDAGVGYGTNHQGMHRVFADKHVINSKTTASASVPHPLIKDGTPLPWLSLFYHVSLYTSMVFAVLALWLAAHGLILTQKISTVLLTKYVRMPIPRLIEVENARTDMGQSFERNVGAGMRVPFLMRGDGVRNRNRGEVGGVSSSQSSNRGDRDGMDSERGGNERCVGDTSSSSSSSANAESSAHTNSAANTNLNSPEQNRVSPILHHPTFVLDSATDYTTLRGVNTNPNQPSTPTHSSHHPSHPHLSKYRLLQSRFQSFDVYCRNALLSSLLNVTFAMYAYILGRGVFVNKMPWFVILPSIILLGGVACCVLGLEMFIGKRMKRVSGLVIGMFLFAGIGAAVGRGCGEEKLGIVRGNEETGSVTTGRRVSLLSLILMTTSKISTSAFSIWSDTWNDLGIPSTSTLSHNISQSICNQTFSARLPDIFSAVSALTACVLATIFALANQPQGRLRLPKGGFRGALYTDVFGEFSNKPVKVNKKGSGNRNGNRCVSCPCDSEATNPVEAEIAADKIAPDNGNLPGEAVSGVSFLCALGWAAICVDLVVKSVSGVE